MSVLRKDPISGAWVIIAKERQERPTDLHEQGNGHKPRPACPFCEGSEGETPFEIRAQRAEGTLPNGPGWSMRVVPNRYAALRIEGELGHATEGIFNFMNGVGAHEVIIETPVHEGRLSEYSERKLAALLEVYRERLADLHRDKRFHYVQVFRNYGIDAGASLRHPHSQVIALPMIPRWLVGELQNARAYHEENGRCIFCDLISQDMESGGRVVDINDDFIALAPYAPRLPYETWILPRRHGHDFIFTTPEQLPSLARILKRTTWALQEALGDPPFNFIIHSAPDLLREHVDHDTVEESYHWHIEIMPRVGSFAGFELGTGFHINPVAPEQAAERMREVLARPQGPPDLVDDHDLIEHRESEKP